MVLQSFYNQIKNVVLLFIYRYSNHLFRADRQTDLQPIKEVRTENRKKGKGEKNEKVFSPPFPASLQQSVLDLVGAAGHRDQVTHLPLLFCLGDLREQRDQVLGRVPTDDPLLRLVEKSSRKPGRDGVPGPRSPGRPKKRLRYRCTSSVIHSLQFRPP